MQFGQHLFAASGGEIGLAQLVGKGGEGSVYLVKGKPGVVAKVLHSPSPEHERKLRAMLAIPHQRLTSISAWPIDLLRRSPGGAVCGFLMPHINAHAPVHKLYSPHDRKTTFPKADWRFLVAAAANIAAAITTVHEAGMVVGDINENGVVVGHNALVRLIDCDSFQFQHNGETFYCKVGVPLYTPPELIGKDLGQSPRSQNHDAFGLAVLIFHLLMMGRHPYAGRYTGSGDMSMERAMSTFRYAYSKHAGTQQMAPPPNSPPVSHLPPAIAENFESAFGAGGATSRPSARVWAVSLSQLSTSLTRCQKNPAHTYFNGAGNCVWCDLENRAGITYFFATVGLTTNITGDGREDAQSFETLLQRLLALPMPTLPPFVDPQTIQVEGRAVPPEARANTDLRGFARVAGIAVVVVFFLVWPKPWFLWLMAFFGVWAWTADSGKATPLRAEIQRRRAEHQRVSTHLQMLIAAAARESGLEELNRIYRVIVTIETEYKQLPAWRYQEEQLSRANARERQVNDYLDRFSIRDHYISGIGDTRKAVLRSFGIETAADVTQQAVMQVKGFGPGLTRTLVAWRNKLEAKFVFDASRTLTGEDLKKLDLRMRQKRNDLMRKLIDAGNKLEDARNQALVRVSEVKRAVDQTARLVAQAREDLRAAERLQG